MAEKPPTCSATARCRCFVNPVTIVAPLPQHLIPKGMLDTSVFVDVLITKHQIHQPVERWLLEWRQNGLDLAKGTVYRWQRLRQQRCDDRVGEPFTIADA